MTVTTLAAAVADAATRLADAGVDDARAEARLLVREVAGIDGATLMAYGERRLDGATLERLSFMVTQRCRRLPMAQVLGRRGFWDHEFLVTADTLTPRPESEVLIEAAFAQVGVHDKPHRVLDLGTGSGCLLLTLLATWPRATGVGVDCSAEALAVACANAARLGLGQRAAFIRADWSSALAGRFDIVIANPPYIESTAIDDLEPEVARHEPRLALDGGADGLDAYRILFPVLPSLLTAEGIALFEHGAGQGTALAALAADARLTVLAACRDLAGHDRCLVLAARGGDNGQKTAWNQREP